MSENGDSQISVKKNPLCFYVIYWYSNCTMLMHINAAVFVKCILVLQIYSNRRNYGCSPSWLVIPPLDKNPM